MNIYNYTAPEPNAITVPSLLGLGTKENERSSKDGVAFGVTVNTDLNTKRNEMLTGIEQFILQAPGLGY